VPGAAQAKLLARAREAASFTAAPDQQPAAGIGQSPAAQPEKKKPKREKRKKPEADAADAPTEAAIQKKAKLKAAAQARPEPRASGPGNAEQAATIRQTLGITPSPAAAQAANHFQFQFARPTAAEAQPEAAVQSSSSEEESDDAAAPAGGEDDAEDDGEDDSRAAVDTGAAPRAQAVATPPTVQSSVARELQERAERIRSGDTGQRYIPRR